jgi:hypothetical protein
MHSEYAFQEGHGNCLFRSVSHQLYKTESRHAQIRALAIKHLINELRYPLKTLF